MNKKYQQLLTEIKEAAAEHTLDELLKLCASGADDRRLVYGFAACIHAVREGVGLDPYDEQILAAIALAEEKIVQMATGEGKTLSALFAAFYNVMNGRTTHVMTFNDYLAKRDYNLLKQAYGLLGVSCANITEASSAEERKSAYKADVLYVSAKECCFDYLRDFAAQTPEETVMGELCAAIVDEADSIMIDEARIPLAVAGDTEAEPVGDLPEIMEFARGLDSKDYETSTESREAYLTESGAEKAEKRFGVENLYDDENSALLTKLNDCLKALFLLCEDKDYIVKDGEIRLIDLFTGRAAQGRRYPGTLQTAVELKHGVTVSVRGTVMATVPLQFFLRQYSHLSGMTGTAESSEEEFELLYGLKLEIIPPHAPCIRVDREPEIYYDREAKLSAICRAVKEARQKRQPVLIGTESIAAGEELAALLEKEGVENVSLLTAKNDEQEADIIRNAGASGKVTVSANMAGRGVDIKPGGADESSRDEVIGAGGLLVIGTFLAESARINRQLMGRTGRQGDPGESRLFISLDEEIMSRYKLKKLVPQKHYPEKTDGLLTDKVLAREVMRIQRISEGDCLDERKRLLKYSTISEKHRDQIFISRSRFLHGDEPGMWREDYPELYKKAVGRFGAEKTAELERRTVIAQINSAWSEYLDFTSALREGIHLSAIGGKNPADEYNISVEEYYRGMEQALRESMGESLEKLLELGADKYSVPIPEHIRTYFLDDGADELKEKPILVGWLGEPEEYDDETAEEAPPEDNDETREKPQKKGFFGRLFGK